MSGGMYVFVVWALTMVLFIALAMYMCKRRGGQ